MGDRSKCSRCESTNVYVLRNGNVICRACGEETVKSDGFLKDLIDEDVKGGEV